MELFTLSDLPENKKTVVVKSTSKKVKPKSVLFSHAAQTAESVIGKIKKNTDIHFVSSAEWSTIDLLVAILKQTGPASVMIATWSASEDSTRKLLEMTAKGMITSIKAIFDWRLKVRRPEVYEFAKFKIADVRLTSCHAKVTVIRNNKYNIVINASGNYTHNPRIEAGVISESADVANFHESWMLKEHANADPFNTKKRNKKG